MHRVIPMKWVSFQQYMQYFFIHHSSYATVLELVDKHSKRLKHKE